jgi:hypothetical protein
MTSRYRDSHVHVFYELNLQTCLPFLGTQSEIAEKKVHLHLFIAVCLQMSKHEGRKKKKRVYILCKSDRYSFLQQCWCWFTELSTCLVYILLNSSGRNFVATYKIIVDKTDQVQIYTSSCIWHQDETIFQDDRFKIWKLYEQLNCVILSVVVTLRCTFVTEVRASNY